MVLRIFVDSASFPVVESLINDVVGDRPVLESLSVVSLPSKLSLNYLDIDTGQRASTACMIHSSRRQREYSPAELTVDYE